MTEQEISEHIQRVQLHGYSVLPNMLTAEECVEAERQLERLMKEEADLPGSPYGAHGTQVYNLFNKARVFERVYQLPPLLRVIRHFLGDDAVLSSVQAHIVFPGAGEQGLHADGSITGPNRPLAEADGGRRITSHVLGFNVVFCVSDYTKENGATRVVPGSHLYPMREPIRDTRLARVIEAPRGSVLIFNICAWHGASAHRGSATRYAVMTPWRRRWLRGEADLGRIVKPEVLERAGPEGRVIFGIEAREPYTDRWMWDSSGGRPKAEWAQLDRGENS